MDWTLCLLCALVVFFVEPSVNAGYPTPEWPAKCKGKSYCTELPQQYPEKEFAILLKGTKAQLVQGGSVSASNRSGLVTDVAGCNYIKIFDKVYLIRDVNDDIRYVAQNEDAFAVTIEVEECSDPGPIQSSSLDEDKQKEMPVYCYETRIPFKFPVLSLDGTKLESVAPKGGLPVSCSAKIIHRN